MASNSQEPSIVLKVFAPDGEIHRVRLPTSSSFESAQEALDQVLGAAKSRAAVELEGQRTAFTPSSWTAIVASNVSVLRLYVLPSAEAAPAEAEEPAPELEAAAKESMDVDEEATAQPSNSASCPEVLAAPAVEAAELAPSPEPEGAQPAEPPLLEPSAPSLADLSAPPLQPSALGASVAASPVASTPSEGSQRGAAAPTQDADASPAQDGAPAPAQGTTEDAVVQGIANFAQMAVSVSPTCLEQGIRGWQGAAETAVRATAAHARAHEQGARAIATAVQEHQRQAAEHQRRIHEQAQQQAEAIRQQGQQQAEAIRQQAQQHAEALRQHQQMAHQTWQQATGQASGQAGPPQGALKQGQAAPGAEPERNNFTPPSEEHTIPTEAAFFWPMPSQIRGERKRIARCMITSPLRIIDSEIFMEDGMIAGPVSLEGTSRLVLVRGMIAGPVTCSSTSQFENRSGLMAGPVIKTPSP